MKKILLLAISILIFSPWLSVGAEGTTPEIFIFTEKGCPYCTKVLERLGELEKTYPDLKINEFDLRVEPKDYQKYKDFARTYKVAADSVPMTYIGDKVIKGAVLNEIDQAIENCRNNSCPDPEEKVKQFIKDNPDTSPAAVENNRSQIGWIVLGVLGIAVVVIFIINRL